MNLMRFAFPDFKPRDRLRLPLWAVAYLVGLILFRLLFSGLRIFDDPIWLSVDLVQALLVGFLGIRVAWTFRRDPVPFFVVATVGYTFGCTIVNGLFYLALYPNDLRGMPLTMFIWSGYSLFQGAIGSALILASHHVKYQAWWPEV